MKVLTTVVFLFTFQFSLSTGIAFAAESSLEKFLQGLDTFSAGFQQRLLSETGENLETAVGVVYIRRPGKFHWAYWEPYSQMIISDGGTLWIYDEDLEQVTIRDVTESIDDTPAALLTGEVDLNEHYVVISTGTVEGVEWLELTPRNLESEYDRIELGFREDKPVVMRLKDNLGQQTEITFHDTTLNPELGSGLFEFAAPEGVDVIDSRRQ